MGTVLFLIIGGLLTLGIFCFLCSNTRMVSFDGVNGFARGYLDLFIWSVLIAAGIIAGVWYIFGGIFSFIGSVFSAIFGFIFSEKFIAVIGGVYVLYITFCRFPNMKKRKKELDKSECFEKHVITFEANEDGIKRQELWYFDKNRFLSNGDSILANAVVITKPDSEKNDLEQFGYRTLLVGQKKEGGPKDYQIGVYGPKDDNLVSMSGLSIKKLECVKDNLGNIELLHKIAGDKDNVDLIDVIEFTIGDNTAGDNLYKFMMSDKMKSHMKELTEDVK